MRRGSKTTTYGPPDENPKEVSELDRILKEVQTLKDENASLKNELITLYRVFLHEHSPFLITKL